MRTTIYIHEALFLQLKKVAEKDNRTVSNLLTKIAIQYLKKNDKKEGKK